MKKSIIAIVGLMLLFSISRAAETSSRFHAVDIKHNCHLDDINIDVDDNDVVITNRGNGFCRVIITEDYELYIDGNLIKTTPEQKKLLAEYYDKTMELVIYAEDLGYEGAKIGVAGAKVGLKAMGGVLKLLFTDYDEDDLERELEAESARIEARAAKLEDKADELETLADQLELLTEELSDEIPELEQLEWFSN
nr:hypothetical protein [candidate division Zixibacteria bacterium]